MKKITLILLTLLLFQTTFAQVSVFTEKFETCEGTYDEFGAYSDGSSDYFIRTNGSIESVNCVGGVSTSGRIVFTNTDGYYYTGEDTDRSAENPNTTGEFGSQALSSGVHFANIDVSSYNNIQISCSFAARNAITFEPNLEYIKIYVDPNNTASWQLIGAAETSNAVVSSNMSIDTDLDGVGDGTVLTEAFQGFTFNVPSGATIMNVRIEINSSSGSEEMAFDSFEVKGDSTLSSEIIESDLEVFEFYPNPFDNIIAIKNAKQAQVFIYDSLGKLVTIQEIDKNDSSINLTEQKSGIYFAKIIFSNGNSKTLKLVKK